MHPEYDDHEVRELIELAKAAAFADEDRVCYGERETRKRLKRTEFNRPGHSCCECGRQDRYFDSLEDDTLHPVCNDCQKAARKT